MFGLNKKIVSCNFCKCLVEKKNAYKVVSFSHNLLTDDSPIEEYYCKIHKKPYNSVHYYNYYGGVEYYGVVKMDKNGNQIGKP